VEIQFGEGGEDSKIFVDELLSAYLKYAKTLNLKSELLESTNGHVTVRFFGKGAGNAFQYEGGQHCCQRIPPTESKGRKQTSYIKVAILPIYKQNGFILKESDLEVTTQGGHGKGGQHQNRTDSAVRMKHLPTKLSVFINGRDQHSNRRTALKVLAAKVQDHYRAKSDEKYNRLRRFLVGSGNRGDKIRTYNFMESRCVDHRFSIKTKNIKRVMKGEFSLIHPNK